MLRRHRDLYHGHARAGWLADRCAGGGHRAGPADLGRPGGLQCLGRHQRAQRRREPLADLLEPPRPRHLQNRQRRRPRCDRCHQFLPYRPGLSGSGSAGPGPSGSGSAGPGLAGSGSAGPGPGPGLPVPKPSGQVGPAADPPGRSRPPGLRRSREAIASGPGSAGSPGAAGAAGSARARPPGTRCRPATCRPGGTSPHRAAGRCRRARGSGRSHQGARPRTPGRPGDGRPRSSPRARPARWTPRSAAVRRCVPPRRGSAARPPRPARRPSRGAPRAGTGCPPGTSDSAALSSLVVRARSPRKACTIRSRTGCSSRSAVAIPPSLAIVIDNVNVIDSENNDQRQPLSGCAGSRSGLGWCPVNCPRARPGAMAWSAGHAPGADLKPGRALWADLAPRRGLWLT